MKNGYIFEQLKRQQQEIQSSERKIGINQETNQIFSSFISSAAQNIRSSSNHEDQTLKPKKEKKERKNKL